MCCSQGRISALGVRRQLPIVCILDGPTDYAAVIVMKCGSVWVTGLTDYDQRNRIFE